MVDTFKMKFVAIVHGKGSSESKQQRRNWQGPPGLLTGVSMQTTAWNWWPTIEYQKQAAFDSST